MFKLLLKNFVLLKAQSVNISLETAISTYTLLSKNILFFILIGLEYITQNYYLSKCNKRLRINR
jgi:hypothetical protein